MISITAPQPFVRNTNLRNVMRGPNKVGVIVTHRSKPGQRYEVVIGRTVAWKMTLKEAIRTAAALA